MNTKLLLLLALLSSFPAHAAFDMFLKIEGIEGESTDDKHRGWIEVSSFDNHLLKSTATRSVSTVGVTKTVDKATPLLAAAIASGRLHPAARIEFIRPSGDRLRFYSLDLDEVLISRLNITGDAASDARPREALRLHYNKIRWSYVEFDPATDTPKRELATFWDLARNVGGSETSDAFRVSRVEKADGSVVISWTARAGHTYRLLASQTVDGQYATVQNVIIAQDGEASFDVPTSRSHEFFVVEDAGVAPN